MRLRRGSRSGLGSQVDVDLIASYLLFLGAMLLMLNFISQLQPPFASSVISSKREGEFYSFLSDYERAELSIEQLREIASLRPEGGRGVKVEYLIIAFDLPEWDEKGANANETEGLLQLVRRGNQLEIEGGSKLANYRAHISLLFPSFAGVSNETIVASGMEKMDRVEVKINEYGQTKVSIELSFGAGDLDEIIIWSRGGLVLVEEIYMERDGEACLDRIKIGGIDAYGWFGMKERGEVSRAERVIRLIAGDKQYLARAWVSAIWG